MKKLYVAFLIVLLFNACTEEDNRADLIIINAKIWTGDETNPIGSALAVSGDRIAFVGGEEGAMALKGSNTGVQYLNELDDELTTTIFRGLNN